MLHAAPVALLKPVHVPVAYSQAVINMRLVIHWLIAVIRGKLAVGDLVLLPVVVGHKRALLCVVDLMVKQLPTASVVVASLRLRKRVTSKPVKLW